MHSDLSMQKEFDIKWKSHDISGSASLALWANMSQSTTQLGSKRQSQGKHPYPTINIFICCCVVIICPVSIYFYVSYVSFSVIFARVYILFFLCFLIVHFHQDGFPACSHLALLVSLFEVSVMLKFLYVLFSRGHTLYYSVDIHWHGLFQSS